MGKAFYVYTGRIAIDTITLWFILVGVILIVMGSMTTILDRLPFSAAMCYFAAGYALGPAGLNVVFLDWQANASVITLIAEIALLVSLFAVGLRLRVRITDNLWRLPWRLGVGAMLITILLLTVVGMEVLNLPLGAAMLLAAILAPTDPVLASDVQIRDVGDSDRLRFSLSGEGGLNDGTAYPFAMLGLFLLGSQDENMAHYAGEWAIAWACWGVLAGLASGWVVGKLVVKLILYLRRARHQALGMEEFLGLGIIALSYGLANTIHGIGFLAVFTAGVTMRGIERQESGEIHPAEVIGAVAVGEEEKIATSPKQASAYMTEMVLEFNRQLEHLAEFVMVLLIGILASQSGFSIEGLLVALLLLLLIRPISVFVALRGSETTRVQRDLLAWFGIRGVGSLYYLSFALQYHWDAVLTQRVMSIVATVLAVSIFAHGTSATPLMAMYLRRRGWK